MGIGDIIDSAVAVLSPKRALERQIARRQYRKYRSNLYAGAQTTKSTGAWSPVNNNVNDLVAASAPMIRARVRQLVRDFPYFARAVNVLVDYTVGEGIQFQSKVQRDGKIDHKKCVEIEDCFKWWADEADYAGRLHFYEMMRMDKRQDCEAGEFLLIKRFDKKTPRFIPYCLQMVESEWLTQTVSARPMRSDGTTRIEQGIEIDIMSGRPLFYHFTDPDSWGKTEAVPASQVIHGFESLRPSQVRGISPFAPGLLVADDLASLMDAELDASKMAAKWLAMIKTPDPMSRQIGMGITTGDNDEPIEEIENAIIEYLRPGEEVTLSSNPRPGSNFPPFVRLVLCMFSVTTGIPYELLSGDYQGMNYSTGRTIRNDFRKVLRPLWRRHIRQFCVPATRGFFDAAVMSGKLNLPGYYSNPMPWIMADWQPPGMESTDPLRESKANIDDVAALQRSPQEIIKARGRDPEDVLREIAEFKELCDKYDLTPADVSTAVANNPAAVADQRTSAALMEIMDALDEIGSTK
jgi:lambda family phage portal protein